MADYCSYTDVEVITGLIFTSSFTARITLAKVNTIITDITNEIDFTLNRIGIATQPTDARILARLKMICKYGVGGQVLFSYYGNADNTNDTQADKYINMYKGYLKEILDNPEIYGAITGTTGSYASNQVIDGTKTESDNNSVYVEEGFKW